MSEWTDEELKEFDQITNDLSSLHQRNIIFDKPIARSGAPAMTLAWGLSQRPLEELGFSSSGGYCR